VCLRKTKRSGSGVLSRGMEFKAVANLSFLTPGLGYISRGRTSVYVSTWSSGIMIVSAKSRRIRSHTL